MGYSNTAALFNNAPEDVLHLFEGDVPNTKKIGQLLEFSKNDIADATGIPKASIRFDGPRIPQELLVRMREWAVALNLVASFFNDPKKTVLWFHTPNSMLGYIKPADMIRVGRFDRLLVYIQQALQGRHS
jgi:uncharacterized protein (DUF2384 family)